MIRMTLLTALLLAGSASAVPSRFPDVPRDHWARNAIDQLAETGILEGHGGRFHGAQLVNRYQMAVIMKRVLDEVKRRRGIEGAPSVPAEELRSLEASMMKVADELARLHVEVQSLEDGLVQLRVDLDGLDPAS